ncbi:Sugar phosphate isomerase/epimerase [Anaerocolumna jejuensis DSM 15929]|uniref:Sugar phosphate isomerase/epimerase n=1 Tax=Anaerocolumna jejuensis DSM 15929 TaxID=1121322 RepID=A0A1M6M5S0_9FIRM|nr:TIM barrel protein [Anaerocolumna jejuensis]SHJ78799.1 Sugar phosphate isomerase/epimerase [Anaerocolumna jejuensis DSM 15929]
MRIGGGVQRSYHNPDEWIKEVLDLKYSAVLAPVNCEASGEEIRDYIKYIKKYNLILGEVGVWKNPIAVDEKERKEALEFCKRQLALADEMAANCCVNIVGSRGEIWDGLYADNYSESTYCLVVDSICDIIDSVKPVNTFYTIETMPWMVPDSAEAYLKLLKDVNRSAFAAHLDYANLINTPQKYAFSTQLIEECFQKLGPYIKSIHAKDVIQRQGLPCLIEEVMPGKGTIDFIKVLHLCEKQGRDTTVFVEHLNTHEEYKEAVAYIRKKAGEEGIIVL